jgi:hypothetical protein
MWQRLRGRECPASAPREVLEVKLALAGLLVAAATEVGALLWMRSVILSD